MFSRSTLGSAEARKGIRACPSGAGRLYHGTLIKPGSGRKAAAIVVWRHCIIDGMFEKGCIQRSDVA